MLRPTLWHRPPRTALYGAHRLLRSQGSGSACELQLEIGHGPAERAMRRTARGFRCHPPRRAKQDLLCIDTNAGRSMAIAMIHESRGDWPSSRATRLAGVSVHRKLPCSGVQDSPSLLISPSLKSSANPPSLLSSFVLPLTKVFSQNRERDLWRGVSSACTRRKYRNEPPTCPKRGLGARHSGRCHAPSAWRCGTSMLASLPLRSLSAS